MIKKMSAKELLQRYADGERDFSWVDLSLKTFNKLGSVNLSGANLSHADLYLTDLSHADLSMVDLSWARMDNTKLKGANLQGANLSNARLKNVKLMGANLSGANLSGSYLHMTIWDWEGANLCGANLFKATIFDASSLRLVDKRGAIMPNGSCVPDTLNKAQIQLLAKENPKELESIDQTVSQIQNCSTLQQLSNLWRTIEQDEQKHKNQYPDALIPFLQQIWAKRWQALMNLCGAQGTAANA